MKILKVLSIIGIVLSSIGLLGTFLMLVDAEEGGVLGLLIFGFYLALSIQALQVTRIKQNKKEE